ncbi:LPXTG cell wall anchor domain-containing protein [Lactococcus lactis]|uniref:LPXTG cell wall anchor domain-containing protein n=1 Tax=Lactococcus lactis TaxID=1358 RepID=A0AAW8UBD1_9LACT|nr:LPXTG cell wall anchor domain-containing protein [Lactococcus lactis]MDT2866842.1 LPXTG cell wall anchor domain-containing protein [Lactococcus lactis]MDT2880743.1 LPXTG cell wall anchor domain-containing protein [Lactococcus lactis]MDT2886553.1 LPXTG cell wall anchor domain-containing protein [Lactococcus lactis]MDT2928682.1 LPXTG cell wall anchor domain-containing protein [Lactococcus lactis]MDT2944604.1 LPXTG cell wall anchor domain-containing protein [Lactococcus lactis]
MKNTKNTRVQKQQKKAKKQRRISSTLMCGLVLSSVALPAVAVLADNAVQNQAPQTTQSSTQTGETLKVETPTQDSDTVNSGTEQTPATDETTVQTSDSSTNTSTEATPTAEQTTTANTPSLKKATGTATLKFVDAKDGHELGSVEVNGEIGSQVDIHPYMSQFADQGYSYVEANPEAGTYRPFMAEHATYTLTYIKEGQDVSTWEVGQDGFFYGSWGNGVQSNPYVDFNVTYTNAKTGEVLGTSNQDKAHADSTLQDSLYSAGLDTNTWGIAEGTSPYIDSSSSFDYNGKSYYSGISLGKENMHPVNGVINLTIPLTNLEEDASDTTRTVQYQVQYVDDSGKDILTPQSHTVKEGTQTTEYAPALSGYKLAKGQADKADVKAEQGMTNVVFHYVKADLPPTQQGSITFESREIGTNKLIGTKIVTGESGSTYNMEDPTSFAPEGYTFMGSAFSAYRFTDKPYTVTLYYFEFPSDSTDSLEKKLEALVSSVSPLIDKSKYEAKYVDKLKEAIDSANEDMNTNKNSAQLRSANLDPDAQVYQYHIDNITKLSEEVKAHPLSPTPSTTGTINFKLVDESGKTLKAQYVTQDTVGNTIKVSDSDYFHIDGYKIKSGAKEYTYTDNTQTVTITYSKVEDNNGGNTDNNGGSTNNNSGNSDNDNKTSDSRDSTSANKNSSSKSEVTSLATDTVKESKATLPTTGEANNLWLFLSGLGVLLATGFALIFKRKRN